MEQCYLMPGQERCEKIKDANGVPKVSYSYRSLQGAFFHCVSRCVEEALADMRSGTPMNRLVQGDVGSGKTAGAQAAVYA